MRQQTTHEQCLPTDEISRATPHDLAHDHVERPPIESRAGGDVRLFVRTDDQIIAVSSTRQRGRRIRTLPRRHISNRKTVSKKVDSPPFRKKKQTPSRVWSTGKENKTVPCPMVRRRSGPAGAVLARPPPPARASAVPRVRRGFGPVGGLGGAAAASAGHENHWFSGQNRDSKHIS